MFSRLVDVREAEFDSYHRVAEMQRRALAHLLAHKLPQIPYYENWHALVASVSSANAAERLLELPILEKVDLQKRSSDLRLRSWRGRSYTKTTGGSTGQPVTVEKDAAAIAQEMAVTWAGYGWFGIEVGDPCVRFWGQPSNNLRRRLRYVAADIATNRLTLSAFGYTGTTLDRYVDRIQKFKPAYLYGYVSALEELAKHIQRRGGGLDGVALKAVVTTSEVLTEPQRALLADTFGSPVQNEYGCGELGPIAYQCPAGSLHLFPMNHYVEVIGDDGRPASPGEKGQIVITDLTNDVMPLIRYKVGDIGALGDRCICGRSLPVLATVFGREYDYIRAVDGSSYHGEFFMYLFEDLRRRHPELGQFKVVQTHESKLAVQVVAADSETGTDDVIVREFRRRLPQFDVTVHRVNHIPRQPSGKVRVVEGLRQNSGVRRESASEAL